MDTLAGTSGFPLVWSTPCRVLARPLPSILVSGVPALFGARNGAAMAKYPLDRVPSKGLTTRRAGLPRGWCATTPALVQETSPGMPTER